MPECSASVRIATEPVRTPATIFRAISAVLEKIETAAARLRPRVCWPSWLSAADIAAPRVPSAASSPQPCEQRARRVAAVRYRILVCVGQLGHRASGSLVGDEQRVVAEAARPVGGGREGTRAPALEHVLGAVRRDMGDDADVAQPGAGGSLPVQLVQVLSVG